MKRFASIDKLDTVILYILELASSLSVLLLAFGLVASMANVLTKGGVLTDSPVMQSVWAWTQCTAIDASVAGAIIRTFQYRKEKQTIKMWLYAFLSGLLLFTAAIVSNIESVQQTLNIALDQAYTHVFIPLELLIWVRSIAIVCLIVAHALRHVDLTSAEEEVNIVILKEENTGVVVMPPETACNEEEPEVKKLTPPKLSLADMKKLEAENNKQKVSEYMAAHPDAKATEVAKVLSLSLPTVRKHMQSIRDEQ